MKIDFTFRRFSEFLNIVKENRYSFHTFHDFIQFHNTSNNSRILVLRHDVDARPNNSLTAARLQAKLGIAGTYYFRMVPQSYDERVIKEVVQLGHEVGYHYETMDTCKGNIDKAYEEFCRNLDKFRKLTSVYTISMHGSPMSPFDNRDLWKKYDYRKLGIVGEPYFDIDFNNLFYITDTGRRWDGTIYNVRDKATRENPITNQEFLNLRFHTTLDIINAVESNIFPNRAMLNFHPQRWNDKILPWTQEFLIQNIKNQVKRIIVSSKK